MSCLKQSLDPIVLRRVFLLAARSLFSDAKNYGEYAEELSRFVYSEDKVKSTLDVELDYLYNPEKLSPRHAVYVGITDFDFKSEYLNHHMTTSEDGASVVLGQPTTTGVVIRCVTPMPDEALRLSTVSMSFLLGMRRMFMEQLELSRFDLQKVTAPALIDKAPTALYVSTAAAALAFNFEVTSYVEGHRIKTFDLGTTVAAL